MRFMTRSNTSDKLRRKQIKDSHDVKNDVKDAAHDAKNDVKDAAHETRALRAGQEIAVLLPMEDRFYQRQDGYDAAGRTGTDVKNTIKDATHDAKNDVKDAVHDATH